MSAFEFTEQFGASCRTKNTHPQPDTLRGLLEFGWSLARGKPSDRAKRLYPVPARSKLPPEFIRLDPWEAEYLFTVAALATTGIVEIGRYRGGSTFLLACANGNVPIWSIDVAPRGDNKLKRLLARFDVGENVELLVGDSQLDAAPEIREFDLLFIDGSHSYENVKRDLERFFPDLSPGGNLLLHDCRGEKPVQRAVIEFVTENDIEIVRSPHIPAAHWLTEYGSIAHLRKPLARS
jgi:predicted O-methyltransferase YrrM